MHGCTACTAAMLPAPTTIVLPAHKQHSLRSRYMEDRDAAALQRASKHSARRTLASFVVGVLGTVAVFSVAGYGPRWSGERARQCTAPAAPLCRRLRAPTAPAHPPGMPCAGPRPALLTRTTASHVKGLAQQEQQQQQLEQQQQTAASAGDLAERAAQLRRVSVPWTPLLSQHELERGLTYYGSGERLRAVAAKLLAGQPIKVWAASLARQQLQQLQLPPGCIKPCFAYMPCLYVPMPDLVDAAHAHATVATGLHAGGERDVWGRRQRAQPGLPPPLLRVHHP